MNVRSTSTKTALPTGSITLGICHKRFGADTTTGIGRVPGGSARSIWAMTSLAVSSTFSIAPPLPTRWTSAIFLAMVSR